jgi:hypothetical protein
MGDTSTLAPAKTRQARQQHEYAHGALLLLPALLLQLPAVHTVCVFEHAPTCIVSPLPRALKRCGRSNSSAVHGMLIAQPLSSHRGITLAHMGNGNRPKVQPSIALQAHTLSLHQ